jgi:hypothetical protein
MIRWAPWISQEERDADRFEDARQGAFARGMRQAAVRDGVAPDRSWRPGPVPRARQVRKREREVVARQANTGSNARRASVLARAMGQSLERDRATRRSR